MAQNPKSENCLDADNTVIHPCPQRVRNILTLEERVSAIKAYEQRPMYTKVARMYNCSWEQIKNIITNRDAIMEFYEATHHQRKPPKLDPEDEEHLDLKQRKIKFLGECVYESIQRYQYHTNFAINEEFLRVKAMKFQELLKLEDFTPNKQWLNLFKATYNISLSNKQIAINRTPPASFDLKDIMTYCIKIRAAKTNNSLLLRYSSYDANTVEYENKRLRKLKFLEKVLREYLIRAKCHHKSLKLDDVSMRKVALEFNEILKVQDFDPTIEWIQEFRKRQPYDESLSNVKKSPMTLDLKDILSYCSRMDSNAKATTITLAPKETSLQMRVVPKYPNPPETALKFQQSSIIYLDDAADKDIKPDIDEMRLDNHNHQSLEQPPPLKIRKIESINNDPELQRKLLNTSKESIKIAAARSVFVRSTVKELPKLPSKSNLIIKKLYREPAKEERISPLVISMKKVETKEIKIKEEDKIEEDNYILPTNTIPRPKPSPPPPAPVVAEQPPPPITNHHPHPTHYLQDDSEEELPRHVSSFKDVLLLLKPLEEYAMLKENYRAIGLITQLEEVLKNVPETNNAEDEFIG